jgi:hypothetical protein
MRRNSSKLQGASPFSCMFHFQFDTARDQGLRTTVKQGIPLRFTSAMIRSLRASSSR